MHKSLHMYTFTYLCLILQRAAPRSGFVFVFTYSHLLLLLSAASDFNYSFCFVFFCFFNEQPGSMRNAGQPSRQHTCTITGAWAHLLKTEKLKGNVFILVTCLVIWVSQSEQMEVMAWLTHWKFDCHLVVMCKNAAFLRFIIIHLLLVQPMPYPQLHLAELLDDKSIDSFWNNLSKPHKVQCTLGMRWGFCRLATRQYHLNDGAHIIYPWMERWRLTDGTSVVTSDSRLCLRERGPRRNKLCHLSHTNPPAPPHPPFVSAVIYSETARMSSHGLLHSNIAPQRSTHLLCNTANLHPYEFKFIKKMMSFTLFFCNQSLQKRNFFFLLNIWWHDMLFLVISSLGKLCISCMQMWGASWQIEKPNVSLCIKLESSDGAASSPWPISLYIIRVHYTHIASLIISHLSWGAFVWSETWSFPFSQWWDIPIEVKGNLCLILLSFKWAWISPSLPLSLSLSFSRSLF